MAWQDDLRRRTHSPDFLGRMVATILIAGLLLGIVVHRVASRFPGIRHDASTLADELLANGLSEDALREVLAKGSIPFEKWLDAVAPLGAMVNDAIPAEWERGQPLLRAERRLDEVRKLLVAGLAEPQQQEIVDRFCRSFQQDQLHPDLLAWAAADPPWPHANYAVARWHQSQGDLLAAAAAYEREGARDGADRARERAVLCYLGGEDLAAVRRLSQDPRFVEHISAEVRLRLAASAGDWGEVWRIIPRAEWERLQLAPALLALFAGTCWLVIALQMGEVLRESGARTVLCLSAVGLGVLSLWPTDWFIFWQEYDWGLRESDELAGGILYYVVGVGLREEVAKLLLVVPLLPWLVARGRDLEILIVGACVGLGFALGENSGYFAMAASSSLGRFLTANFFHMAATGLATLYLVRGIQQPQWRALDAAALFLVIVFAHGMYDAAIAVPVLAEYGILSPMIYILLSYQFFHELRGMRSGVRSTVSLRATFLGLVSLVAAVTFVYLSAPWGAMNAARLMVPEALAMATMVFMFLRELP